ncbi:MAG: cupin domain-containing protein [Spongiibacteraceae bacterium]
MTRDDVIHALQLTPHIEGGFFRRTYASTQTTTRADGVTRPLLSSIFYMLTADHPRGRLHRNRSDILHYWHAGGALRYWLVKPDGELVQAVLGPDLANAQQLQLLVPGGWWKATELIAGTEDYGLLSEAVCPGFDFADMTLATTADIAATLPQHLDTLQPFCGS